MLNTRDLYFCLFLWGDEVKIARKFHRKRSSYRVKYSLRSCSKAFSRSQKKNQNGFSFHTSLACISVLFLYDRAAMQLQLYSKQAHAHWDPDSPPKQCTTMITASHPLSLIPSLFFKTQVLHSLRLVVFMRRPPSLWCPRPPFERTNPRPSAAVDNRPRSAKRRSQIHERLKWPLQLHGAQQKFQFLIKLSIDQTRYTSWCWMICIQIHLHFMHVVPSTSGM